MLSKINPIKTESWIKLERHFDEIKDVHMKDLFNIDRSRFENLHIRWNEFIVDFSKNRIHSETLALLIDLAKECKLPDAIHSMFSGEKINETEDRAVLHIA